MLGSEPCQEEKEKGFQTWDLRLCGVVWWCSPEVRGGSTAPRGPPWTLPWGGLVSQPGTRRGK